MLSIVRMLMSERIDYKKERLDQVINRPEVI